MSESIEDRLEYFGDRICDLLAQISGLNQEIRELKMDFERRVGNVEDDVRRVENEVNRLDR